MFPLSHIYVSTKVAEKESDLLVLGSVIPDLAWFSEPLRGALHNQPDEFWGFVKEKYPDFLDLALGVRLHSQIGKGADYYSDDETVGYAKVKGRVICNEVKKVLGIRDKNQSLVYAHNFIEAAVDLNLSSKFPKLSKYYESASGEKYCFRASLILAEYLGKETKLVETEIKKMMSFFKPENRSTAMKITKSAFIPYFEGILGRKLDCKQILSVINHAKELTRKSFLAFLDETVEKMKINFESLV